MTLQHTVKTCCSIVSVIRNLLGGWLLSYQKKVLRSHLDRMTLKEK